MSEKEEARRRAADIVERYAQAVSRQLGRGRVTDRRLDQRLKVNRQRETTVAKIAPTRYVVRYVPVEEGAEVQLGDSGLPNIAGAHKLMGYQPAPLNPRARKPYEPTGWLVVLVNEAVSTAQPRRLRRLKAVG